MCSWNDVGEGISFHFPLYCTLYDDLREWMFNDSERHNPDLFYWTDEEKIKLLFDFDVPLQVIDTACK